MSTQVTDQTNGRTQSRPQSSPQGGSGDKPAKQKFGIVLQGGGALGAYEVGAVEYLYERGMECAIVTGSVRGGDECGGACRSDALPATGPPGPVGKACARYTGTVPSAVDDAASAVGKAILVLPCALAVGPEHVPAAAGFLESADLDLHCQADARPDAGRPAGLGPGAGRGAHAAERLGQRRRGRRGHVLHQRSRGPAAAGAGIPGRCASAPSTCRPAGASRAASRGRRSGTGPTGTAA